MTDLIAYHGNVAEKKATLRQLREHRAADQIVQGTYWSDDRGCAVGCLTHHPDGGHEQFPERWGIPVQLAYLIDQIFESLPVEEAREWPLRFMSAVPVGADLSGVWDRWSSWMLHRLIDKAAPDAPMGVVVAVAALFDRAIEGDEPSHAEWRDAAWDAWAAWDAGAARAAAGAAEAAEAAAGAARSAWAAEAARSAWAAEAAGAARSAWAAEAAAELVRLVKTAPKLPPGPRPHA